GYTKNSQGQMVVCVVYKRVEGVEGKGEEEDPTYQYVRPFKVLEKVGVVAYKLELPQELIEVHNTFHVSNLKKFHANEPLVVPLDGLHIDDKLHFVEEPVEVNKARASDEELEAPMEDQPLPADASPTALSPGYIADSDPEEDEEDPADHPADGGDNDDNESSDDDDDDDDVEKDEEDEEKEEHLAPADPSVVPTHDPVPSS
ncbi:hypothetical protein Tco_0932189, partial [Tanacetum coccineum]